MILKKGVKLRGLKPEMLLGITICNDVYKSFGVDMVITSVNDSKHGYGSLHYSGSATDLRTRNVPNEILSDLCDALKASLGVEFDVILESNHIHVEYQPKGE